MNYTKEQISEIISKHAEQRNGINDLLSIMLESIMMDERGEFSRAVLPESLAGTLVAHLEGKQPEWNHPDEKVRGKRCRTEK